jgi:hypothetical protein
MFTLNSEGNGNFSLLLIRRYAVTTYGAVTVQPHVFLTLELSGSDDLFHARADFLPTSVK